MNDTVHTWHQMQQAAYQRRIAREGLLAALRPYGITVRKIPAQRKSINAAGPLAE